MWYYFIRTGSTDVGRCAQLGYREIIITTGGVIRYAGRAVRRYVTKTETWRYFLYPLARND